MSGAPGVRCKKEFPGGENSKYLGGGSKYFLFSSLPGEDSHFD